MRHTAAAALYWMISVLAAEMLRHRGYKAAQRCAAQSERPSMSISTYIEITNICRDMTLLCLRMRKVRRLAPLTWRGCEEEEGERGANADHDPQNAVFQAQNIHTRFQISLQSSCAFNTRCMGASSQKTILDLLPFWVYAYLHLVQA